MRAGTLQRAIEHAPDQREGESADGAILGAQVVALVGMPGYEDRIAGQRQDQRRVRRHRPGVVAGWEVDIVRRGHDRDVQFLVRHCRQGCLVATAQLGHCDWFHVILHCSYLTQASVISFEGCSVVSLFC